MGWHGYARFEQRAEAKHPAARCMSVHDARIYLRLNAFPQLPHRISPGLYPPIRNLVRQCGQVTVYPPGLRFMGSSSLEPEARHGTLSKPSPNTSASADTLVVHLPK